MFVILEPKNKRIAQLIVEHGEVWKVTNTHQWHGTTYDIQAFDGTTSSIESWQCRIVK